MFKPATVAIDNHVKAAVGGSIAKGRDNERRSNTQASFMEEEALKRTQGNSLHCPPCGGQYDQFSLKPLSLFTKKNNPCIPIQKGSVSFSFSKKAPVKLESSASVFNDTIEEKHYEQEPPSHKMKTIAEAEFSLVGAGTSSITDTENNEQNKQPQTFSSTESNPFARVKKLKALMLKENKDEAEKEYYCYSPTHCKTDTNFPFLFLMKSSEKADMAKVVSHNDNIHESQTDGSDAKSSIVPENGNEKHENTDAKGMAAARLNSPAQLQMNTQEVGKTLDQDVCKMKAEETLGLNEKQTEAIIPAQGKLSKVEPVHRLHLITEPFLSVLSKDDSTRLQWPSELLLFTQTEPSLSYSCNPLYFDFKLSRNKSGSTEGKINKGYQQNAAIPTEGDNRSSTVAKQNGSTEKEQDPNIGESAVSHKSKSGKSHNPSSKKSIRRLDSGHVRKRKKKLREEDKQAWKVTEPALQNTEGSLKEGKNSKLIPKRPLKGIHAHSSEELEQVSSSITNKQSIPPVDIINKKQKVSSSSPLNINQGSCEDRKAHRSRHDSLNSNTNDSDSTEENHREYHRSFSHCSYEDDSQSNTSNRRKSRSYSSSQGSSLRSSSDTSSDHSRTSHRSRNYSDRSSEYSSKSQSRYCSKRHHRSHYKCHSRQKKKKHSYSSSSAISSDDDHYHRRRSGSHSRSRGSAQTRMQMSRINQLHSRSSKSRSRQPHSRNRSRYRSRSRHSRNRQESSRGSSLRRSLSRNTDNCRHEISSKKLSRHRSFSKGRVYHIKSSLCNSEIKRGSGKHHGIIKNEDTMQNYSPMAPSLFQRNMTIGCSIFPLKELIQDEKKSLVAKQILENEPCKDNEEKTNTRESASSIMGLKSKDSPEAFFGPRLPPSMDNVTLWSLIGKLTASKKVGGIKDNISEGNEPEHLEWNGNEIQPTGSHEENLEFKEAHENKVDIDQSSTCNASEMAEKEKIDLSIYQVQAAEGSITPVPEEMSDVVSSTADVLTDSSTAVKEKNPRMSFYDSSSINSVPLGEIVFDYYGTNSQSVDEMDSQFKECSKSISPPLASQPIIFLPEEMEKYSKLQFQAQQHIQQQLLAKQVKTFSTSAAAVAFTPVPAFQPVSLQQPSVSTASSVTTVHHTLLQHHAAASLTAALHPGTHHQVMSQLHHITQPHVAPFTFSPITQAIIPTHPATFLAGHPLHFIPAAAIHPAHLALHPLPHTALCPTLFAPHPATSTIHFHPLIHPLFPGHELQHRSGPST